MRLLVEAERVLPWPTEIIREVIFAGTLAENLEAMHRAGYDVIDLERRARLIEETAAS